MTAASSTLLPIVLYLALSFVVALWAGKLSRKHENASGFLEEYFLGSRSMGGFVLAMTVVASYTSASSFIGGPGVAYTVGLSWVLLAMIQVPTTFLTLGVLGKRFAIMARKTRSVTLTDFLRARYRSDAVVVLCSLAGCRDEQLYAALKKRLYVLQVHSLTMAQESLAEVLFDKHWWNPFPLVRYTERPDVASAHVQEGGIVVITDNSPSVMLLPVTLMDFVQEAQDYYFPPLIGTYLRIIRILIFLLAQFLTPVWFWLNSNPDLMPEVFRFTLIDGGANISIFWQLIILEIGIDAMKMASLNTPSSLSSSFSIIGALILGDFAVKAGWFDAEIILYMAFAALANFTQPSFELGYAIKLVRMLMLAVIALFPAYGLWIALALLVLLLISSRAPGTRGYLYPLIPFDAHACGKMLLRRPLHNKRKDENE